MKRPRITFRRNRSRTADSAKSRPGFLSRLVSDIQDKEYVVFLKPVLKPFKRNPGSRAAVQTQKAPDAPPPALSPAPDPALEQKAWPTPPAYPGQTGNDVVDPRLVEEVFARSALPITHPEEQHELGAWDLGEQALASVSSKEPEKPTAAESEDALENGLFEPVETVPGATGSSGPLGSTDSRFAKKPLVHTMVEAAPDGPADGDGGMGDFLSEDLQDLFSATDYAKPRTKALLKSREHVDVNELAKELKEYARSVGAAPQAPETS